MHSFHDPTSRITKVHVSYMNKQFLINVEEKFFQLLLARNNEVQNI